MRDGFSRLVVIQDQTDHERRKEKKKKYDEETSNLPTQPRCSNGVVAVDLLLMRGCERKKKKNDVIALFFFVLSSGIHFTISRLDRSISITRFHRAH